MILLNLFLNNFLEKQGFFPCLLNLFSFKVLYEEFQKKKIDFLELKVFFARIIKKQRQKMQNDKILLPYKSSDNDRFWLIRDDLAVCENGIIFYYDTLGCVEESQFECILDDIEKASCEEILDNIIDLKNIIIDGFFIDLINYTIDGIKFEFSNDMQFLKYKGYIANLDTLEIMGQPQEVEQVGNRLILDDIPKTLDERLKKEFQALIKSIFRKDCNKTKIEKRINSHTF